MVVGLLSPFHVFVCFCLAAADLVKTREGKLGQKSSLGEKFDRLGWGERDEKPGRSGNFSVRVSVLSRAIFD